MKKIILSLVISIIAAIVILVIGAKITEVFFSPAALPSTISGEVQKTKYLFSHASLGFLLGRIIAAICAGLTIGLIVSKMKVQKGVALFCASLFTLLCLYYMYLVEHPVWFWLMMIGSFVPCALIGYRLKITDQTQI